MTLGGDLHILHAAARLRNRQSVRAHALEVKLDRLLDLALDFFDRIAGRHAAGKVGNVRTIVALRLSRSPLHTASRHLFA